MIQDAETDFIEGMGLVLQGDGMPRIAGRLMGFFVLRGGPFSFAQLSQELAISRGSVSTNTRLLEDLGVIERVAIRGERQDYFRLAPDPYARLIERKRERSIRARESILRSADALEEAGPDALGRVGELAEFFRILSDATGRALADLDGNARDARVTLADSQLAAE